MRILAISDIHGCLNTFKALLHQINFSKEDHLFLVGDFIDRGPDSKGVIDYIWALEAAGHIITCTKGNHEQMMLDSLVNLNQSRNWLIHGGSQTLDSFGVADLKGVTKKYIRWMRELPHFALKEDYVFVHAGLNFDMPNPMDGAASMLWIRNWHTDVNYQWLGNRIIVHGHTPMKKANIEEMFKTIDYLQILDIDAGCVFDYAGFGHLCCVDLTNRALYFQERV